MVASTAKSNSWSRIPVYPITVSSVRWKCRRNLTLVAFHAHVHPDTLNRHFFPKRILPQSSNSFFLPKCAILAPSLISIWSFPRMVPGFASGWTFSLTGCVSKVSPLGDATVHFPSPLHTRASSLCEVCWIELWKLGESFPTFMKSIVSCVRWLMLLKVWHESEISPTHFIHRDSPMCILWEAFVTSGWTLFRIHYTYRVSPLYGIFGVLQSMTWIKFLHTHYVSSVNSLMWSKIGLLSESLPTHITFYKVSPLCDFSGVL